MTAEMDSGLRRSRRIGLTNEDVEALEQTRDRTRAEPHSFE